MKLRPFLLTLWLAIGALTMTACRNDQVVNDLRAFDALANETIKSGAGDAMYNLNIAKTHPERAKIMGDYATAVQKEVETLSAFKAQSPQVQAAIDTMNDGLRMAAYSANKQKAAFAAAKESDDPKPLVKATIAESDTAMQHFIKGAAMFRQIAHDRDVDVKM